MNRIGPITKKLQRFEDELKIAKIGLVGVEVGQKVSSWPRVSDLDSTVDVDRAKAWSGKLGGQGAKIS